MRKAFVVSLLAALSLTGCLMPPSRGTLLNDAARDLNVAARFGRLDLAAQKTSRDARQHFLERRAHWGRDIRIVDVELSGVQMQGEDSAEVQVDVSWVRNNEGVMRSTRLAQLWRDGDGDWMMERERRIAGDLGLFGEPVPMAPTRQPVDRQFPTRVIR